MSDSEVTGRAVNTVVEQGNHRVRYLGEGQWEDISHWVRGEVRMGPVGSPPVSILSSVDLWQDMPEGLVGSNGYTYDLDDLHMRYWIRNSPNSWRGFWIAIKSDEKRGLSEPLTGENFWDFYGETLGGLILIAAYTEMALEFAEPGSHMQSFTPSVRSNSFAGGNISDYGFGYQGRSVNHGINDGDFGPSGSIHSRYMNDVDGGGNHHGNSRKSARTQHGYEIYDVRSNEVMEYGISGQRLNVDGSSPRFKQKLRTKYNNNSNYDGRVVKKNMRNRNEAFFWEKDMVESFKKRNQGKKPGNQVRP